MKNKKYFCYEIYKNLAIWSANGKLSYNPCSYYTDYIKTSDKFDLSEVWNSPEHNQLKQMIDNDQPIPGCSRCYREEEHGLVSRRLASKNLYENYFKDTDIDLNSPQSIDYTVGNLCNLKCMICGPQNSSAWISDFQQIYPLKDISDYKHDKHNLIEISSPELLNNIKNIHFHGGGEPLLSNNHINLLKTINEIKGLSDVRVFYNTNGTKRASQELLDLWAKCQLVELYFSIDDIGLRFNYQRTGADWDEVVGNLQWYKENMPVNHMFKISCTWSHLNLFYLDELTDWYKDNFNSNRLGDPINLIFQKAVSGPFAFGIKKISTKLKLVLVNKFKNYPRLLELVNSIEIDDFEKYQKFWQDIDKVDKVRNIKFRTVCPELVSLLS
jgi:MoaA/NifB/PqqE/SkfB family radical SAM enzyme